MNQGAFFTQINECNAILKQLDMVSEYIPSPSYPPSPRAFFKGMLYKDVWRACLRHRYYHFQLSDNSLFYFEYNNSDEVSLSYYDFPYAASTYKEFLREYGYNYSEVGDELREDYDDYVTTCLLKESLCSMRYDVCYTEYDEARHPISHLHIGHANNIRIRTEKIMGPLPFLFLVLRQNYPHDWKNYVKSKQPERVLNAIREKLPGPNKRHPDYKQITQFDMCELFLS